MGKIIVIASGKGGVGKTTLTAALGQALARMGRQVCMVDACAGLRGLDLVLNVQDQVVFDWGDLDEEDCAMKQVLVPCGAGQTLYMAAAPLARDGMQQLSQTFSKSLARFEKRFDIVLVDSDSVFSFLSDAALSKAESCLLICGMGDMAQRNTEAVSAYLHDRYRMEMRLIMNAVDGRQVASGAAARPEAVAAYLDIPLLGCVQASDAIRDAQLRHETAEAYPSKIKKEIEAIALRLDGRQAEARPSRERRKSWFSRMGG